MIKKKNNNNHSNGKRKYDWKHYLKFMLFIVIILTEFYDRCKHQIISDKFL